MKNTGSRKKRSTLRVAPFVPMLLVVFVVGWIIYWIGELYQLRQNNH